MLSLLSLLPSLKINCSEAFDSCPLLGARVKSDKRTVYGSALADALERESRFRRARSGAGKEQMVSAISADQHIFPPMTSLARSSKVILSSGSSFRGTETLEEVVVRACTDWRQVSPILQLISQIDKINEVE